MTFVTRTVRKASTINATQAMDVKKMANQRIIPRIPAEVTTLKKEGLVLASAVTVTSPASWARPVHPAKRANPAIMKIHIVFFDIIYSCFSTIGGL
jgi:hypothetical protein